MYFLSIPHLQILPSPVPESLTRGLSAETRGMSSILLADRARGCETPSGREPEVRDRGGNETSEDWEYQPIMWSRRTVLWCSASNERHEPVLMFTLMTYNEIYNLHQPLVTIVKLYTLKTLFRERERQLRGSSSILAGTEPRSSMTFSRVTICR